MFTPTAAHIEEMGLEHQCHTNYIKCMTMLSFRITESEADDLMIWAKKLGIDKSELLRDALHQHLVRLVSENDADQWVQIPHSTEELALAEIADWGVAEDWEDWADETR